MFVAVLFSWCISASITVPLHIGDRESYIKILDGINVFMVAFHAVFAVLVYVVIIRTTRASRTRFQRSDTSTTTGNSSEIFESRDTLCSNLFF